MAGDVFDAETVPEALSGQLLARLKAYPALTWHLLPGNHDPARAGGVWATLRGKLPANVRVHLEARPAEMAPGVVLLPAPLMSQAHDNDPTAWMDGAATPAGTLRIGLAHGSVQGFGSAGEANVPIDPARVKSAGLSYLALGDWHGMTRISDRAWYSGTPEPDGFRDNDPGNALIVRIDGAGACRKVERVRDRALHLDAPRAEGRRRCKRCRPRDGEIDAPRQRRRAHAAASLELTARCR